MVGGLEFKIIVDEGLQNDYGECDSRECIIKINPKHLDSALLVKRTILHEMTHAALGVSGLSEKLTDKQEEAFAVCIENMLINCLEIVGE